MAYKPSDALIKQSQRRECSFEICQEQDKRRSFYKVIVKILGNIRSLSCLPMVERDYRRHMQFSDAAKWNTLEIKYYDKATSIGLVEDISFTLDQWLYSMLMKGSSDDRRGDCISSYLKNPNEWFEYIEADFKSIFGSITDGVRSLHYHGDYHGNLNEGIVISKNAKSTKGRLFNMKEQKFPPQARKDDLTNLIDLIRKAIRYPFDLANSLQLVPSSDILELSLTQLQDRVDHSMNLKSLRQQWDLSPMILWDDDKMVEFLMGMHWVLYRGDCAYARTIVEKAFVSVDWGERVRQKNIPNLTDSLSKTNDAMEKIGKLGFWRNCMVHLISIEV